MNVEPICPGCRIRRRLLSESGSDGIFIDSALLQPHLPNCPARVTLNVCGIAVETFIETFIEALVKGPDDAAIYEVPRGLLPSCE